MLTKKYYEMIAEVIHAYPSFAPNLRAARESFANAFADKFAADNPKFDRARFLKACGVAS